MRKTRETRELVDLLYDKKDDHKRGPYLRLLMEKKKVRSVGMVRQFEWTINPKAVQQWMDHKGARDITSSFWEYPLIMSEKKSNYDKKREQKAVFIAQLIASKDNDVGFTWTVSDSSPYKDNMKVSVSIWCERIKFFAQFNDVLMSQENLLDKGVECSGVESLFKMKKLKDKCQNGMQWVVTIKAYTV